MMNSVEISFTDVNFCIDGNTIIHDVSCLLQVQRLAVLGTNGSGKSTFLRLLDGLEKASSGTISIMGMNPDRDGKQLHKRVGFVFTNPDTQIIMPTVHEDVAFSLRGMKLSKQDVEQRVNDCLESFGLSSHSSTPAHSLSGGQKQMLALAAVLVRGPELVIADEPTTMLDLPNARLIGDYLVEYLQRPVIIATHDLELASRCDYALRFADGQLVEQGSPELVIEHYRQDCSQRYSKLSPPSLRFAQ
ncbi:energy-coupling factor ABC transporter ATP-binding protein [Bifidobacterium sp.]|jgi:biotin transport system ATP-binding protein|uniref:energy-coupling factor ABC transporter ATP-binding protein n=1 Tax=Bifidobacterium sp. TaxID=41200 RepID=UPI0025C2B8F0|nr:ABC transporter ATP-binding protein [Bifidobacterium sp.]MCI1635145.1 energy-coupling factor ABC transporter ATP-binding protein [Bifidobacterium sp.]